MNKNALSYWFPLIQAAGLPVPRTTIVQMPKLVWETMLAGMNGEVGEDPVSPAAFFDEIATAGYAMGWPCFLRSDHASHKHAWNKTCFLTDPGDIPLHIYEIAEFSEMCSLGVDLSWDRWAVREMLPTMPVGYCRGYGDMPICREFRFFVDDGVIRCVHPYWPEQALRDGDPVFRGGVGFNEFDYDAFCKVRPHSEYPLLTDLAQRAGAAVGGSWSVDILETRNGWFVTDMAIADDSYHWPGCPEDRSAARRTGGAAFDAGEILAGRG